MAKTYRIVLQSDGMYRVDRQFMLFWLIPAGWDKKIHEIYYSYADGTVSTTYSAETFMFEKDARSYILGRRTPMTYPVNPAVVDMTVIDVIKI